MAVDHSSPPSEGSTTSSLAHQINVAITSSHTRINRLILERMPRAVPPHADNPSAYITGLIHIGAVYVAFESMWQNILGIHPGGGDVFPLAIESTTDDHVAAPQITERTRHILQTAYWPTLLRTARIKADIQSMTGWPEHVIDEQIRLAGTSGRLGKFTLHIRDSVTAKPHLLLSYAYSLYLALLSGGTYIRMELLCLKPEFWQATPSPIKPNMVECRPQHVDSAADPRSHGISGHDSPQLHGAASNESRDAKKIPLEFLDFDPPLGDNPRQQAKELKAAFKRRFAEAEQLLAEPERNDIVKETAAIFHSLEEVVGQLDVMFGTAQTPDSDSIQQRRDPLGPAHSSSRGMSIGFRFRDSIAIAKARFLRTRRRSSGTPVGVTIMTALPVTGETDSSPYSDSSAPLSKSEAEYTSPRHDQHSPNLAHDAVVPGGGFRTVHYGRQQQQQPWRDYNEKQRNSVQSPHCGFNGALADDAERCPMSRGAVGLGGFAMKEACVPPPRRTGPDYAFYAMVSNLVVLVGIALIFAAYLYVRHTDVVRGVVEL